MKPIILLGVGVLALVLWLDVGVAQYSEIPKQSIQPAIFVYKNISHKEMALGETLEITTTVYNFGQNPAYDVVITDLLEDGTVKEQKVDTLSFGESIILRYRVTPTKLEKYPISIAEVIYNLEQGNSNTTRKALSNMVHEGEAYYFGESTDDQSFRGSVEVLLRNRYNRLHAYYIKEITAYIFLGCITTFFPFMLYRVKNAKVNELLRYAKRSR